MPAEPVSPVTEEELRSLSLAAARSGESVDGILRDYLRFGFEAEQQESDRIARHAAPGEDDQLWVAPVQWGTPGRHRAAG